MAWDLNNDQCLSDIKEADVCAQKLIEDLQLRIYVHDNYGKGFMKTCRVSPDAYIQMALQLAYYRLVGMTFTETLNIFNSYCILSGMLDVSH